MTTDYISLFVRCTGDIGDVYKPPSTSAITIESIVLICSRQFSMQTSGMTSL